MSLLQAKNMTSKPVTENMSEVGVNNNSHLALFTLIHWGASCEHPISELQQISI